MLGRARWAWAGLLGVGIGVLLAAAAGQVASTRAASSDLPPAKVPPTALSVTSTPTAESTRAPTLTPAKAFLSRDVSTKSPVAVELPRSLSIPSIGVDAGFEYVGLAADGAMDVPKDASKVAWYELGPRPGEQGNAVVAGHVDWGGKLAVFWGLRKLTPGDPVQVVAMDDSRYDFAVEWVRMYPASSDVAGEVFGQPEASELTLITCGGEFDRATRQYLSRVVVRALKR